MHSVVVLGGGKVGKSVAELLLACGMGAYKVTLCDRHAGNLKEAAENIARLAKRVPHAVHFETHVLDAADREAVKTVLNGKHAVICMLPFDLVAGIAEIANGLGVHYFDVTEDVETTDRVRALAPKAKVALVPQCGLAPGYIAIAANEIARQFREVHDLVLRVGALPQYPTNMLRYNVTWSIGGVVNEYCEPCNVMLGGEVVKVPALEGLERFSFEGVEHEAFYTSGGVGSLIDTLTEEGKTTPETRIAYKTIRYPGHCDLMKFLLQDLRLGMEDAAPTRKGQVFNRQLAMDLLDHAVPRTLQDVVVVFINGVGIDHEGIRRQINFKRSIPATSMFGRLWPAIELTTAAGVCAMVDLHRQGAIAGEGFIRQESVSLAAFNGTIFGLAYENPGQIEARVTQA